MKKILYVILGAALFVSCTKDSSQLSVATDNVNTGEVTDITTNSATIQGYINYYGAIGELLAEGRDAYIEEYYYSKEEVIEYAQLAQEDPQWQDLLNKLQQPTAPDSLWIVYTPIDVNYIDAGVCLSKRHDFYDETPGAIYHKVNDNVKIQYFSLPLSGLDPATTYFYKTYLHVRLVYDLSCEEIGWKAHAVDNPEFVEDYYVYGTTQHFTTLR